MKAVSSSSSPGTDVTSRSFPEFLTEVDAESEFSIQEEMIEKVMEELYKEITTPPESACRDYLKAEKEAAASSPSITSSLSSDRGKISSSESCGASVSDSASSVMAGVEFTGCGGMFESGNMSTESSDDMARVGESEEGGGTMNGWDGVEFGDEWLEKVMGWAPLQVEGWI